MKKKYNLKNKIFFTILIIIVIIITFVFSPLSNIAIKKYLEYKIDKYLPNSIITYFDRSFNNFSLTVKKGANQIKIYGQIIPLNALYEANVNDLNEITPKYQGKLNSNGKIYVRGKDIFIEGLAFFADGYMNFVKNLDSDVGLKAKGKDFDIQKLLYMLKINYPYIEGKSEINIKKNSPFFANLEIKMNGIYEKIIKSNFNLNANIKMKDKDDFNFDADIMSDIGNINLNGNFKKFWKYKFKVSNLNLKKLQKILLFPFIGYVNINGYYDSKNDILKFNGKNFTGYKSNNLNITFNMDVKEFYKYIKFQNILKGYVSGNIKINKKNGSFNIVCNKANFLNSVFTKKIRKLTGINLAKEKISTIFLKGNFNDKKLIFEMLSSNNFITISIKNGILNYPNDYTFLMLIKKKNNLYKILIKNGKYKLIEKKELRNSSNNILVF